MESPRHSSPESDHHHDDQQGTRKRKRKTFSCDACRKRKLKCDREFPVCGRCHKSGNASTCVYESVPEPASKPALTPSRFPQISESDFRGSLYLSSDYTSPQLRQTYHSPNHQAERIAALESKIAQIDPSLAVAGENVTKRPRIELDTYVEPTFARGKDSIGVSFYGAGFKTAFFGPTSERNTASYYPAIMKLYPELKVFASFHNLQNPLFAQVRTHITAIRKNSKVAKKILPYPSVITLFDAVPEKDVCTKMVSLYWETIASTYHIFHGPTFWASFWLYWGDPSQRTESFACTILLMLACVSCHERQSGNKYRGLSNTAREQASYWIESSESWIIRQSRKHLTIESFQHRILLEIAKQINAIKKKQVWEHANGLLAFAISTGLHQDPSKIDNTYVRDQMHGIPHKPKTTPYEREMRRRLWAAIVEIEMQASIDKGIPSSRLALLADCGRPSLLVDDQFDESSTALPGPESRSKYAAISYLRLSQDSLRLRASLSEIINTGPEHLAYDEIMSYDDQIKRSLAELPDWVKDKAERSSAGATELSAASAALLELQLRQFQILLHIPFARRIENDSRSNLSRMTCIDIAVRILQIHTLLGQAGAQSPGSHWLNLMREDVFRAIMAICYNLVLWRGLNNDLSSMWMKDIYTERAAQGMELFKDKVLTLGEHFVQLWYSLAAIGMVRTTFALSEMNLHVTSVAEELSFIFGSVCNSQEEPSNEQTAAGALTALATPNSSGYDAVTGATPIPIQDLSGTQPYIDGVDMSSWGFDDIWPFNNTGLSW